MSLTNTPDIVVNGSVIHAAEIDTEIQYHPADTRRNAAVKAAETLILGELLIQKAIEKGLTDAHDRNLIEQQPDLIDSLIESEAAFPQASEQECLNYFEANIEKFCSAPLIEASHILLAADPKDLEHRAETRELAENIIQQLKNKEATFGELAKAYSVCPSKDVGGSLGQLSNGQTVSEFERQVFAAQLGLMPTPVETRYGYHVVFIARKVEGEQLPFDVVKDKIQTYLNEQVQRKSISQYLRVLVGDAHIEGFTFDIDASPLMQ
ncbi:MAG: peptidylprolyl isomerase [Glaciecola sp.]|jgi:peptidyl-prolyl cis-trans isomerase C